MKVHCGIFIGALAAVLATQPASMAQGSADAFVVKLPGASMASSITLSAADASGGVGQTVEIPVNLTNTGTASPATFQVDFSFDRQKLSFESIRAGPQLSMANKSLSSNVLANGDVRVLTTGMNQTVIAGGIVAYASFTLQPVFVGGSSAVTLKNCVGSSALGSALATGCNVATVKAFGCDLNGDGAVNVVDLQLIVNEALGTLPATHDLNGDGKVNVADVQKTVNAALGVGCLM